MKYLFLILLFPILLLAQDPPVKPPWVEDLEAEAAQNPIEFVRRTHDSKPEDSVAGYWKMSEEKELVEGGWHSIPLVSTKDNVRRLAKVYTPAHYRIIRHYAWIETGANYQGNTNSKTFHEQGCRYWDCADCTEIFETPEAALEAGYKPCGVCKPLD